MSAQSTPSKRSHDQNLVETNGRGKWRKSAASGLKNPPSKTSPPVKIRILFPASKIGNVIGKAGSTISRIRQETGANVQVEETVSGCHERVIVVIGSNSQSEVGSEQEKADVEEASTAGEGNGTGDDGNNMEATQPIHVEDPLFGKTTLSVQKALSLVLDRVLEGDSNIDKEEGSKSSSTVVRLLVHSSQVSCLLEEDGSISKQLSSDCGAEIQKLPSTELPSCASSSDELVQISGTLDAVKSAFQSVSERLLGNPVEEQSGPSSHSSSHASFRHEMHPQLKHSFRGHGPPYFAGSRDSEIGFPGGMNSSADVLTFRLLCPGDKVGSVIGKGGTVVKAVQNETGCEIKVLDDAADSDDRIIVIAGPVHLEDRISAPQDAVLRVQSRIFRAAQETDEKTLVSKLLVSSNQTGCLLGKGGSIIAEMRKSTGAYIRILGKDQVPKCASENDEVVQITGDFEQVQEAILQITTRLRNHFMRDAYPSNPAFLEQMPPFPSYMGRREFSPPGMYPDLGPSFHKFDSVGGLPPHGGFHPHDDHPPFVHDFPRPGVPPHMPERFPPSAPWGPQGQVEGGAFCLAEYAGVPQKRIGGFGGRHHPAIITSTTVEVVVPRSVVPAIYGEDGGCLRQIREISDAKVTITDPKPGAAETIIIISGTPEQTNAAQSLIQAFVICEAEES